VLGVALGAAGFFVGSNVWISLSAVGAVYEVSGAPARFTAIVPGAGLRRDGTPGGVLEDRLQAALDLYDAGRVQRILVSGDHGSDGHDEVNAMYRWLRERGVSDEHVFLDHAGFRTLDTMERAARVFEVAGAIVCTQRRHMARSLFLAERAGIDAVGVAADRRRYTGRARAALRESIARPVAWLDAYLLGTEPRFLGEPISIRGDGRATHDEMTVTASATAEP